MKTKVLSGIITGAILLWATTLFFSKVMLVSTIILALLVGAVQLVWTIYQTVETLLENNIRRKNWERRYNKWGTK